MNAHDRYLYNKERGKCPSHPNMDVIPGKKCCQLCVDNVEIRKEKLINNGKCPHHPEEDIVFGYDKCQKCFDKKKELYYKAKDKNKCPNHPSEDIIDGVRCQKCVDYYNNIKNNGMCPGHPDRPIVEGKNCCDLCLQSKMEYHKRNKINGRCHDCLNPAYPGKVLCTKCLWKRLLNRNKLTDEEATKILEEQNYTCSLSGRKLEKGINASPDHIEHKCNGGTNTVDNVRFVDVQVNITRADYDDDEFIKMCEDVINYIRGKN